MPRPHSLLAAALLLSLAAFAFASRTAPPAPAAPPAAPGREPAHEATTDPAQTPPSPPRPGRAPALHEHTHGPPLTLSAETVSRDEAAGVTVVRATITATQAVGPGVRLRALAPSGGAIVGAASETLEITSTGDVVREFHIRTPRPPTEADPIKIVVDWQAPGAAMGLHAERQLPPASEIVVPAHTGRPIPPPTRLYRR